MFTKILKWFFIGFIGLVVVAAAIFLMLGGGFGERADRFSVNKDAPIVFAHKGLANYYAESSMASIIASVNMGFTAIEVDVTVTKDHRLIVFHDDSGKRLLGIEDDITDLNFEDIQRKALTFNGMKTEERIIPLDEFLSTYGDSLIIYLDIKIARKSVADTLIAYLERYNLYNTTLIADADLMFLSYLKYQEPKAKTILEGFSSGKEWTYSLIPRNFKPDYYSTSIGRVDEEQVQFLREKKLLNNMIVYGVNQDNIDRIYELGVQNIILDYDTVMGAIGGIESKLAEGRL